MADSPHEGQGGPQDHRRDFLDGVAVSAAGLAAAAASPQLTGAEATLAGAAAEAAAARATTRRPRPGSPGSPTTSSATHARSTAGPTAAPRPLDDGGPGISAFTPATSTTDYDLVVVGAGASGIAAAKWYQDRFGPDAKILLVDSLPDFGGHSHRNEFHIPDATRGGADVMLLRNGGTVNLD